MLGVMMPFHVPLLVRRSERGAARFGWLSPLLWLSAALSLLGLVLSSSRGAWLALLLASAAWIAWRLVGTRTRAANVPQERVWLRRVAAMVALLASAGILMAILGWLILSLQLPGANALWGRFTLLRDAALLARDYFFTGAGLGTFEMQFSIYTLLIHVGYIVNSHNMLMDLVIEQGLGGLVGYLWLVVAAVVLVLRALRYAEGRIALIFEASMASLVVGLVHGLFDDILYGSRGLLLLFIPFGLIICSSRALRAREVGIDGVKHRDPSPRRALVRGSLLFVPLLALATALCWRPLVGSYYADRGAVEQARVELQVYDQAHFAELTMDQVRQSEDLGAATDWLGRAVALSPGNATARQRLAAIALSRDDCPAALAHMRAAWDAGHRDAVTRMLLGDALVANGEPELAAEVVRGLPWAESRLLGQAWSRYWVHERWDQAASAWKAIVLLNPANRDAAARVVEAERHGASH